MGERRRILVTGGVRSGKSAYAERLLERRSSVTYVATGPTPDPERDPEWAARVAIHRDRRPAGWATVETTDPARALREAAGPVLLDCLGTWLTGCLDEVDGWHRPQAAWQASWEERVADFLSAWRDADVVAVTNEVGWGVVPDHPSGRLFADLLGRLNQQVAAASDEVWLLVMGRPIAL